MQALQKSQLHQTLPELAIFQSFAATTSGKAFGQGKHLIINHSAARVDRFQQFLSGNA
ncbi:MAG: hypothetical protein ACYTXY_32915 [Nostoc sp.]